MSDVPGLPNLARLRDFVLAFGRLVDGRPEEPALMRDGSALLAKLTAHDDWLPGKYAEPDPIHYRQYLLHADSSARFTVSSFVWGPGQHTPIHDHRVWGLLSVLRGAERSQPYAVLPSGAVVPRGEPMLLLPGKVDKVSPTLGDVHRVSNAFDDRVSVAIHVYGANIGAVTRSVYAEDGTRTPFVSGYSNTELPNIWDRSAELNAAIRARV